MIPDNTKAILALADPCVARLVPAFLEYAQNRGFLVDPTRVRAPQDKARVERSIGHTRDDCLAGEKLQTILEARDHTHTWCLNDYRLRRHTRTLWMPREHFEAEEKRLLLPAPAEPYDIPLHSTPKAGRDQHASVARAPYSLPRAFLGYTLDAVTRSASQYKSGWRYAEINDLKWSQVDRKQGIVSLEVGTTKNKEARIFYLDEELQEIFGAQFKVRYLGCPYVFHRDGQKIREFRGSWNRACKEAKLGKRLFHDFRRTAVRNMVRAGIPERVAMTMSGHKTRSVFDRYNIVSPGDLKQASPRMETYLQALNHGHNLGTIEEFRGNTTANGVVRNFSLSPNPTT